MTGIYIFTNKITGQSYIGQSKNIHKRYLAHKNRHSKRDHDDEGSYFHDMLRHYGFWNFEFSVLEECRVDELNDREAFYIKKYKTIYPNGYNLTEGGTAPHLRVLKSYDEVNEIIELLRYSTLTNGEIGELYGVSDQMVSDINCGRSWFKDNIDYPIRNGRSNLALHNKFDQSNNLGVQYKNKCSRCGSTLLGKDQATGLCLNCYNTERSKHIPDKNTLFDLLSKNSFVSVGKMFNVSDNAIRNWCRKYGMPHNSSYYKDLRGTT